MPTRVIAVAGSADPDRRYEPPLTDSSIAKAAATQIGRELAQRGFDIVVYSSDPQFIEADVVRGYVASGKARPGSVQVRAPQSTTAAAFPEMATHPDLFDLRPDASEEWEVAFYRSVPDVDGIILIGGGRSVLITGLIALSRPVPIVSVATFGGNALKVWRLLARETTLFQAVDLAAMAPPTWDDACAARLVESLDRQRRQQLEARAARQRAARHADSVRLRQSIVAAMLFIASVVTVPLGLLGLRPGSLALLFLLFCTPLVAGASGATIRMISMPDAGLRRTAEAVTLGLIAGGISVLLFLLSQLAATPDLLTGERPLAGQQARALLIFAVVIGFIAGLTFETVYRRLAKVDVIRIDALNQR